MLKITVSGLRKLKFGRSARASLKDALSKAPKKLPGVKIPKTPVDSASQALGFALRLSFPGRLQGEYRFHATRNWRFDWALPDVKVAIEIEGGIWTGGRHVRGQGFLDDLKKYNAAALLGWVVLRYSTEEAESLSCIPEIKAAARGRSQGAVK